MSGILQGKTAVIAGIANKWSIAYAIAQAFSREGADIVLTYLNDKQKDGIESISGDMRVVKMLPLDVSRDEDIRGLGEGLKELGRPIDALVHSLAFANREDLSNPFIETSREGFLLAQNISAYSLVAMARAVAPLIPEGGSVMTLSYLGATRVMPNYNVMGTAKAALESSMRYLA
ncbi:MAG TPA: SDR family oxidoreductase, partial [Bryobacteraceae bacterium]